MLKTVRRVLKTIPTWSQIRDIQVAVYPERIHYIIPVGPEKPGKLLEICVKEDYITLKFDTAAHKQSTQNNK